MSTEQPSPARCFGEVADAYERGRPTYPREAAAWLTSAPGQSQRPAAGPLRVLELGAGTGKLTEQLVALGHDVHATDPDSRMLEMLVGKLPEVRTSVARAEDIPAGDASYDVVVTAQAFHWFDYERALPEIARVLRPGGHLAVVRNDRDERIPWVKRLGRLIDPDAPDKDAAPVLAASPLFGEVEQASFAFWQSINRESIRDLALSRSNIASLPSAERDALIAQVVAFYDDYGRGMDGMQLPYQAACWRAEVTDRVFLDQAAAAQRPEDGEGQGEPGAGDGTGSIGSPASDGSSTDLLLIDFR